MDDRHRVLSAASGPLNSKLMFIGEAPGRLGADATQVPFHGDKAGQNFEKLLGQVGLTRHDCFITNAVLCNPRNEGGNNSPPSAKELKNCATFLRRQIELINPAIVVTLGGQSLASLSHIQAHDIALAAGVRHAFPWYGRILIPLYHPGQRAMIHRSFLNQLADYRFVAETFRRHSGEKAARGVQPSKRIEEIVRYCVKSLIQHGGEVGYFQLHKLFYLLEYLHYRETGKRLSHAYIIRQKDGPYVTDLHIGTLRKTVEGMDVVHRREQIVLRLREEIDLFPDAPADTGFAKALDPLISSVWNRYGSLSNARLKAAVYMTAPMRALLRTEKYEGKSTFNQPIDFGTT